jgi:conjugal transfer pilin signal peptidase TrbI
MSEAKTEHVAMRPTPERICAYGRLVAAALRRHARLFLALLTAGAVFNHFCLLGVNLTESLPDHVFLVLKGNLELERGDYAAYRWPGGGPYRAGMIMVKIVRGLPGDRVETVGRDYYLNGDWVGRAKPLSRKGLPLSPGPTGIIPPGRYYLFAPHRDSLDSRYALVGWIPEARMVGRVIALF